MTNSKKNEGDEDVLGHMLWDYFHHRDTFAITERNDGFIDPEDPQIWFSKYEDWLDVEKKAMNYVRGKKVLDIGCGAGRHALHLHNRKEGFDVLGIDKSPLAIKICRLRGVRKAEVLSITKLTFKNRGRRKKEKDSYSFDTILMLGNNFGLFESFRRARWLLRNFRKMTRGDASIIAQTIDPYKKSHDQAHLRYHKLNRMKGRMPGQTGMRIRYKNYKSRWFDYLFVSKQEMENVVNGTGWKIERFLDSTSFPGLYIAIISLMDKGQNKTSHPY